MQEREVGVIKKLYSVRHFGFIGRAGKQDLFFHIHDVEPGDEVVQEGGRVEFEVTADQLGRPRASGVVLV